MDSYIYYNEDENRLEVYNEGNLIIAFENQDAPMGAEESYMTYNPVLNRLEVYSRGFLIRSYG